MAGYRQSVCLGDEPLETHDQYVLFFFSIKHLQSWSLCNTLSNERMGLSLTIVAGPHNIVILRSESRGTHDHILLPQIRDSPNLEARSPYLYIEGTGWPSYTAMHCVPLSLPLTTRQNPCQVKAKVTLRLTVSQSALVSSPIWVSWPVICYCLTVTVLSLWGAISDERTGLSFVRVTVCSNKSFVTM
jgi:hypothetical protein